MKRALKDLARVLEEEDVGYLYTPENDALGFDVGNAAIAAHLLEAPGRVQFLSLLLRGVPPEDMYLVRSAVNDMNSHLYYGSLVLDTFEDKGAIFFRISAPVLKGRLDAARAMELIEISEMVADGGLEDLKSIIRAYKEDDVAVMTTIGTLGLCEEDAVPICTYN